MGPTSLCQQRLLSILKAMCRQCTNACSATARCEGTAPCKHKNTRSALPAITAKARCSSTVFSSYAKLLCLISGKAHV